MLLLLNMLTISQSHILVSRHRTLMNLFDKVPVVDKDTFVAPSASLTGDVHIGRSASICFLKGKNMSSASGSNSVKVGLQSNYDCMGLLLSFLCDVNSVSIGAGTNVQDNSLIHVAKSNISGKVLPTIIGKNVTVGHSAVLHGCTVEDEAFIGMGATVLDGGSCREKCYGCYWFPCKAEHKDSIWRGSWQTLSLILPLLGILHVYAVNFFVGNFNLLTHVIMTPKNTEEEIAFISESATNYSNLAQVHAAENAKELDQIEFEKVLRKEVVRKDEEYDSMLGVIRETPAELVLPDKAPKAT
ncbi:hypothetical protein RND71_011861 [Anisodus tanguticus]|uniref:Uncharacterized protein n=1 Tax=Anisodus tanguticus TaxID=243964 RepID=A0AAE1SC50_9SOLA|nr:hypothetical protein RND71_011861 [Anisodus tanguticus]